MQVSSIAAEQGLAFLDVGFDPKWQYEDVPKMPKQRYRCGLSALSMHRKALAVQATTLAVTCENVPSLVALKLAEPAYQGSQFQCSHSSGSGG